MKLINKTNIQAIVQKIKNELDIDISKYQNDEITKKVGSLFMIQNYAIGKIIKPLAIGILLYISFFFIFNLELLGNIVYGIFGLILFVITSLLFGVMRILNSLKKDLSAIFKYSIETFQTGLQDLNKITDQSNKLLSNNNSVNLLFEGFIYSIIAPIVLKKVEGIPVVEKLVTAGVSYGSNQVIQLFNKQNIQLNINPNFANNKVLSFVNQSNDKIENFVNQTNNVVNNSINYVKLPFKISFIAFSAVLAIFLSILYNI